MEYFNLPIFQILIIYSIVILSSIIQSSISFGFALISSPILIMFNPSFVPVPLLLSSLLLSIIMVIRDRQSINIRELKMPLLGRIIGSLLSALIISIISEVIFGIIFGFIIILGVLISFLDYDIKTTEFNLLIAGFFSGLMGTIAAIGGPPIALAYQNRKGSVIRATLSGFFVIGTIISLLAISVFKGVNFNEIKLFLFIAPALIIGFIISKLSIKFLDKGSIKYAI